MKQSYDIPTTLDELVPNCRAIMERLREGYGNPEDFNFFIKESLFEEWLKPYDPHVRKFVLKALGLED